MKITIDTFNKELTLESSESIKDIVDFMQKHFPDEWMNFRIKGNSLVVTIPYTEPFNPYPPNYTYVTNDLFTQTFNTVNPN